MNIPPELAAKVDLMISSFVATTGVARPQATRFALEIAHALEDYMLATPNNEEFEVAAQAVGVDPRFTAECLPMGAAPGIAGSPRWVVKEDGHVLAIVVRAPEETNARKLAFGALVLQTADGAERQMRGRG